MRPLATVIGALLCAFSWSVLAGPVAGPAKYPLRMVNGQTVDLTSLLTWWSHPRGARPLTKWVQVTGRVVGTNSYGWVVEVSRWPSASARQTIELARSSAGANVRQFVQLRNPPVEDLSMFIQLNARVSILNADLVRLTAEERNVKKRAAAIVREQQGLLTCSLQYRILVNASLELQRRETQLSKNHKALDQQIAELKNLLASYPTQDHYTLDCLALETDSSHHGLPIFDHGLPIR